MSFLLLFLDCLIDYYNKFIAWVTGGVGLVGAMGGPLLRNFSDIFHRDVQYK